MKLGDHATAEADTPSGPAQNSEATGLPWFRTWRGVYLFVFGCFVLWVALLLALTVSFS
jgi:hypothetical protein